MRKAKKVPRRIGDVWVNQRMLLETKAELNAGITSVGLEVKALRSEMNGRFNDMDAKFKGVDAQFKTIDARFDRIDMQFQELKVEIRQIAASTHRQLALYEEQEVRNRAVLDGYDQIYRRQAEYEQRLKVVENKVL